MEGWIKPTPWSLEQPEFIQSLQENELFFLSLSSSTKLRGLSRTRAVTRVEGPPLAKPLPVVPSETEELSPSIVSALANKVAGRTKSICVSKKAIAARGTAAPTPADILSSSQPIRANFVNRPKAHTVRPDGPLPLPPAAPKPASGRSAGWKAPSLDKTKSLSGFFLRASPSSPRNSESGVVISPRNSETSPRKLFAFAGKERLRCNS
eukprot:TRINITY_DN3272_c0_g1_i1.p1 TRINITY_DN3272_c0_g1~~TRINITY_DN3272_c0_g1_i1.p1  ORF type:complete len:208 (-),score=38.57 TRINITY_DN3272_c0_g1_i1:510-1133(-)